MFPFEETDDQLQAIEDTKHDMESKKIISCRDKKSRGCAQSPSGNEDDRRTAGGNGCDLRI